MQKKACPKAKANNVERTSVVVVVVVNIISLKKKEGAELFM
jgi:hypothetical protein